MGWFVLASLLDFNSRPHGGRLPHPAPLPGASGFQLTPSRRATIFSIDILLILVYFNSRPHGGRRNESLVSELVCISTHALTEGDYIPYDYERAYREFQLTPSRRATVIPLFQPQRQSISTHALTEGDCCLTPNTSINIISTHALTEGDSGTVPFTSGP